MLEQRLRPRVSLSSRAGFLLADASGSSYLPGHDLELSTISRTFSKLTIVGVDSDLENISAPLSQSTIFGFMGHGEPNETGAGLRINPNLLLKAQNFPPRDLHHLQLAVLAACSTGSSGSDGLLDSRSLVHAFLAGGVPDVVASRWNVDSKATADLISAFYTGVAHNQSAPDALFSARNRLLQIYSHPYYWAGFSVTGKAYDAYLNQYASHARTN
jgi:CHAT domain-containing protein